MGSRVERLPQPRLVLALAVYALVFAAWLLIQPFGARFFLTVENMGGIIPSLLAAFFFESSARRETGKKALSWRFLAVGCLCWALGDLIWLFYEQVLGIQSPFPSIADVAYLGAYPLLFAGILGWAAPRHQGMRIRTSLDAIAVVCAAGTVLSVVLLRPLFNDSEASLMQKLLSAAYPIGDLLLLYAVLVAIPKMRDIRSSTVMTVFCAGIVAVLITDVLFAYLALDQSYPGYSLIDVGWVVGFGLLAYSASLQRQWRPSYARAPRMGPSWRPLVSLALLPPMAGLTFFEHPADTGDIASGVFGISFVLAVVARQAVNFLDSQSLNRRLRLAYLSVSKARSELDKRNVTLEESLAVEQERATVDPLTGVLNRAGINDELAGAHKRYMANGGGYAVGMVDIDLLKTVNDRYGHQAGDEQIKCVVWALQADNALVGRVGGDEFVVILWESDGFAMRAYARDVRARLDAASRANPRLSSKPSVSLGFSVCPVDGTSYEELLAVADARMYVNKVGSRDSQGAAA